MKMKSMKRIKKIYWTAKEANRIAIGFSGIVSIIYTIVESRRHEDIIVLVASFLIVFLVGYYTLRNVLRVGRRKELERQKETRSRIKECLGDKKKKVDFFFIGFENEEWEDLIEEIVENSNFNYYAYVEKRNVIIEVRDKNDKFICQKSVSWQFFDENFILK